MVDWLKKKGLVLYPDACCEIGKSDSHSDFNFPYHESGITVRSNGRDISFSETDTRKNGCLQMYSLGLALGVPDSDRLSVHRFQVAWSKAPHKVLDSELGEGHMSERMVYE
jgi:hypothetical protein